MRDRSRKGLLGQPSILEHLCHTECLYQRDGGISRYLRQHHLGVDLRGPRSRRAGNGAHHPSRRDSMAVLVSARWSFGLAGRAVLACALGFLSSCSDTPQVPQTEYTAQTESTSQNQPTTNTFYFPRPEVTWSVGVDETPAAPDDRLLYLAPTSPIDGVDTDATLRRADAGGVPRYSLAVSSPTDSMSLSAVPTVSCHPLPDGRTWKPVEIRGVEGCEFTNKVGLYFAKWVEGTTEFHYESFDITGAEARKMLADWDPLE